MISAPLPLVLYWAFTALTAAAFLVALAWRRVGPNQILTAREWKAAFQVVAILVLVLIIIYFKNAHRYDAKEFIYGRF